MKTSFCLAASVLAVSVTSTFGQPTAPAAPTPASPPPGNYQQRLQTIIQRANSQPDQSPALTKFNLDFPGGTPKELVTAIEKAMGKHINVIINQEDENVELPPLKMDDIFLPQLFTALGVASQKTVAVASPNRGIGSYQQFVTGYGFTSADNMMTDTSVWYFHVEKPNLPPVVSPEKICQYYPLALYLSRGFTVDDITTAIQTGWKMAGETAVPELNYHKDTKLLIAYGEPNKLKTIEQVLNVLPQTKEDYNGLWNQMKQLQTQVDQLKKQLPPPALPNGAVEIK